MKSAFILLIIISACLSMYAQNDLPKTWTKDFEIIYKFGGSMDGSNASLKFTYDSCMYVRNSGQTASKTTIFLLTDADRVTILKKMSDLKIDKVTSEMSKAPVHDGWSSLLCVGTHCINGGTSAEMSDKDKETYSLAHAWLETFAMARDKKK